LDVVIVCHTEFGYATNQVVFDYDYKQGATDGVKNSIQIADKFDAIVSFMIKPEVLGAVSETDFGTHEVGLHIHPNDRFLMTNGVGGNDDNLRGYGFEKQRAMIAAGKAMVQDSLGVIPRTFVAGKWSVGNETVRAMVELGFTHDASGCPKFSSPSCDWSRLPRICMPYKPSADDYQAPGDVKMIMVPTSKEITTGIISPENRIGLTFLRGAIREYVKLNVPLLHMTLHSPALTSPIFRNTFNEMLQLISQFNVNYRPLSDVVPTEGKVLKYSAQVSQYLMNLDTTSLSYLMRQAIEHSKRRLIRFRKSN
jgi:hypothetical protein